MCTPTSVEFWQKLGNGVYYSINLRGKGGVKQTASMSPPVSYEFKMSTNVVQTSHEMLTTLHKFGKILHKKLMLCQFASWIEIRKTYAMVI